MVLHLLPAGRVGLGALGGGHEQRVELDVLEHGPDGVREHLGVLALRVLPLDEVDEVAREHAVQVLEEAVERELQAVAVLVVRAEGSLAPGGEPAEDGEHVLQVRRHERRDHRQQRYQQQQPAHQRLRLALRLQQVQQVAEQRVVHYPVQPRRLLADDVPQQAQRVDPPRALQPLRQLVAQVAVVGRGRLRQHVDRPRGPGRRVVLHKPAHQPALSRAVQQLRELGLRFVRLPSIVGLQRLEEGRFRVARRHGGARRIAGLPSERTADAPSPDCRPVFVPRHGLNAARFDHFLFSV